MMNAKPLIMLILFGLLCTHSSLAWDKPIWSIEIWKTIGGDEYSGTYPHKNIQFVSDKEILFTFVLSRYKDPAKIRLKNKSFQEQSAAFIALFLSTITGEATRRVAWPIQDVDSYGYEREMCLHPLPNGGFVGVINDRLQVFDTKMELLHSRQLPPLPEHHTYKIIPPRSGYYFALEQLRNDFEKKNEIIDSRNFKTVEYLDVKGLGLRDIWDDRLLATGASEDKTAYLVEKKVGGSWVVHENKLIEYSMFPVYNYAQFANNGDIVFSGNEKKSLISSWCNTTNGKPDNHSRHNENYETNDRCECSNRRPPIIAGAKGEASRIRKMLDLNLKDYVDVRDMCENKILLQTKTISNTTPLQYALSADDKNLVVLADTKVEFYAIPLASPKKK